MYIEPLIGPDTVNTIPTETIAAYIDHGKPAARQGITSLAVHQAQRLAP